MITIQERIEIIKTLSNLLDSAGVTFTSAQKTKIRDVILEHVTYLQTGIVDNKKDDTK